jgi:hypothetical protein
MRPTRRGKARLYQLRRYERARCLSCVALRAVAGLHGIGVVPSATTRPRRVGEAWPRASLQAHGPALAAGQR